MSREIIIDTKVTVKQDFKRNKRRELNRVRRNDEEKQEVIYTRRIYVWPVSRRQLF